MHVTVIIPARDAAATLGASLRSVQAQRHPDWEVIVVDNASGDATAEVAASFAAGDERIRLLHCERIGVSAARNAGLAAARADWVLFLDADDWLGPEALGALTGALAGSGADAAYGGWYRVAADGGRSPERHETRTGDLFPEFARYCVFAIHACVVRRDLVRAVGGFPEDMVTCEDWDLWQRVARTGARFVAAEGHHAFYRMRAESASSVAARLIGDGFRVIRRGHDTDPRVPAPATAHARGCDPAGLEAALLTYTAYAAGIMLGRGSDPVSLLAGREVVAAPGLDPWAIALSLFGSAQQTSGAGRAGWAALLERQGGALDDYLRELERISSAPHLHRRVRGVLERAVMDAAPAAVTAVGRLHRVTLDVEQPVLDVVPGPQAERVLVDVAQAGEVLATVELPVVDRRVAAPVLADAAADAVAWPLLGRFFAGHVHPAPSADHDEAGWEVFLRELFDLPDWPEARFYEPEADWPGSLQRVVRPGARLSHELLDPPPALRAAGTEVPLLVTLAGAPLGVVRVPLVEGRATGGAVMAAVLAALRFELCQAAVREGLIGGPWAGEASLRERLAERRQRRGQSTVGVERVVRRRHPAVFGRSHSRVARLPGGGERGVLLRRGGDAVAAGDGAGPGDIAYVPDEVHRPRAWPRRRPSGGPEIPALVPVGDRGAFERLFAGGADPWDYESGYERCKYDHTLELIPPVRRALEIGCAEGHFTQRLAARAQQLVAADISLVALERAAARCAEHPNVEYARLDVSRDGLPGPVDLVVCSEVLYYLSDEAALRAVADRLRAAVRPGGALVTAHAHLLVDDPDRAGFDWAVPFGAASISRALDAAGLQLEVRLETPWYRVERYRRPRRGRTTGRRRPAVRDVDGVAPVGEAAEPFRPDGGPAPVAPTHVEPASRSMPILMYHRVAPEGDPALRRWRVTPDELREQLRHLAEAGFRSATIDEWLQHAWTRTSVPGRPVLLTFDDGYADFGTEAWPLLRAAGFGANVFLPVDYVGGRNAWDDGLGPPLPLMDWAEARRLEAEGVRFGAHTATHRPLTALTVGEATDELLRGRARLREELVHPLDTIAYPFGDVDAGLRHLAGGCGYEAGLTCRSAVAGFADAALDLPRIEVEGGMGLEEFARRVAGS